MQDKDTAPEVVPAPAQDKKTDQKSAAPEPAKSPPLDPEALAAAHARAHKRLTIIETVGFALLIFAALSGITAWAYYQQSARDNQQPYSSNEYQ